jgi:hypothetical protein
MAQSPEQKKAYQIVKNFRGLNTKANRTAIDESEFSWLENAMPVGYANLKIVPGYANLTATFSNTATSFFSASVNLVDYVIGFEANGSAEAINLATGTKVTIAAAGTFSNAGVNITGWKNDRVLIADPANGYYTWNGTNLVSVGSVGAIYITNGGTGYTSAPTVTISAPNDSNGTQALASATLTGNVVTGISLTEAGSGYTTAPTVSFAGGAGTNAAAIAGIVTFKTGTVSCIVTSGGTGYTNLANTVVTISGGGGANATAKATISGGQITGIVMSNPGTGYTNSSNITVTITGGGGANATAKAIINTNPNVGIASFSGRVWIAYGRSVAYSAAGSYSDFVTVSAGTVTLTDSTLHGNIQQLLSANNFLYVFGDDSINVFSDVRVATSGVTLFTNTNVSASVGSKRPYAIFPYFRSVLFMNDYGVYALVGSTTSKLSDSLDGMFDNIDFTYPITAGQVLVNNILCAAFNFRYYDAIFTNSYRYIQAVFFEKKWFLTSQGDELKYVTSSPYLGSVRLYGTDGANVFQMYANVSANISSIVQTALMPMGDNIRTKQALKFGIEATLGSGGSVLTASIDSEVGSSTSYTLGNLIGWTNNVGNLIPWVNNSSAIIPWSGGAGYTLYKTDSQMYGKYLGITSQSTSPNFSYNGFEFEHELRVRF